MDENSTAQADLAGLLAILGVKSVDEAGAFQIRRGLQELVRR
jgi:hypothetical protein